MPEERADTNPKREEPSVRLVEHTQIVGISSARLISELMEQKISSAVTSFHDRVNGQLFGDIINKNILAEVAGVSYEWNSWKATTASDSPMRHSDFIKASGKEQGTLPPLSLG
jgi:hypothetical protein